MKERAIEIRIAETDAEIEATFEVMVQLRTGLQQSAYLAQVRAMEKESGYKLAVLRDDGRVAAVAGIRFASSLAWAKFVYVDDLVTSDDVRSSGCGKALLEWVSALAKARGCRELHLDSGVQRHDAHRFYLRERMDILCFHFCRRL